MSSKPQVDDIYPLSPMQEGLLFQTLFDNTSTAYFLQMNLHLEGELNEALFRQSWQILAQRHAVLRSAFVYEGVPRPVQVVLKERLPEISFTNLQEQTPAEQQAIIQAYQQTDQQRGFHLGKEPLMRLALFQTGRATYELLWSYHHILLDGWCLGILQREFVQIYEALHQGYPPQLPPVAPYRDYIRWLEKQNKAQAQQYWRNYLAGYEQLCPIPPWPNTAPEPAGDTLLEIPEPLTNQLRQCANHLGVTLNTLLQMVWGVLLARYNRTQDVVFGAVVSGRPAELRGMEEMVGLFINTIPVRLQLPAGATLAQLAQTLQQHALASEPFHHLPLADILSGSPLGNELFDQVVVFENYPLEAAASHPSAPAPLLQFHLTEVYDRTHYPFDLTIMPGRTIDIKLSFNGQTYTAGQIKQVAGHLLALLHQLVQNPQASWQTVNFLPPAEQTQLLRTCNQWRKPYPVDQPIHLLFEQQAQKTPHKIAIQHNQHSLTYAQLNQQANQLAHWLQAAGLQRNQFVAICDERGCDFLAALLGILKAGGAFLPIDPSYPAERVAYMLLNSQAPYLVSRTNQLDKIPAGLTSLNGVFCWDKAEQWHTQPTTNPPNCTLPTDRAYMLYTSGSTGRPKGAIVRHNGAVNHLFAEYDLLAFHENSAFLQSAPSSSDISVWQFLGAVLVGGRTVVADLDTVATPAALFDLLQQAQITLFEFVPVVLNGLLEHIQQMPPAQRALPHLAWAMVTGEAVSPTLVNQWLALYPHIPVVNAYGPTEAADDICQQVIWEPLPAGQNQVPIGPPLYNLSMYILDPQLQLLPFGLSGEICVSGIGVGEGYWQEPEKTAAVFVPNPYAEDDTHTTLYRTGDLGRWRPDGTLEFLGRLDFQVKLRGYRIELGEIENQLLQHPAVRDAVVQIRPDAQGQKQLVGYLIPAAEHPPLAELRQTLREKMPEYMVPTAWVMLEKFPLTPNGKIDRRALPDPTAGATPTINVEPPATELEQKLAEIWQQVLQRPVIGRGDNFFDLGGHSLKAMQVVSRLQKQLEKKLTLRQFFDAPTLAELAQLLTAGDKTAYEPIPPAPPQPHYELSHAQKRLWLEHQVDKTAAYNMPEAYTLPQEMDVPALNRAFTTLIERHEALRTAFVLVDGEPRQKIESARPFEVTVIDLSQEPDPAGRAQKWADQEASTRFDLTRPPLLRATLLKLAPAHVVFLLTLHHIIGDGWSGTVLYQELLTLYEAYRQGRPNPLPPLRVQYKDFAVWQNGRGFAKEEGYWLQKLAGVPEFLPLPYDFPPQAEREFAGKNHALTLDGETLAGLRRLAQRQNSTLSNVVLALFSLLLYQLTKQNELCVGVAVANRNHPDLENLLGFFVNILPLRLSGLGEMGFEQLLTSCIDGLNEGFEFQDYPFDLLIQKLNPRRHPGRLPLINVLYGFQNFADVQVELGTTAGQADMSQARAFNFSFETAKFDMTLFVADSGRELDLTLEYDSSLFRPQSIGRYMTALGRFAHQVAAGEKERG